MLKQTFAIFSFVVLIFWAPVSWAGLDEGWAAHDAGDYETALKEFRPLAEAGDPEAQNVLGDMYYAGQGLPQDYDSAALWYRLAADQGHAWGQMNLGWMYENGAGFAQDFEQAAHWFELAANQGFAMGQYALANLFYDGNGRPQDYAEAARLFRLAAEQGNDWAQYRLGTMYQDGWGVEQDSTEAVKWLKLAAAQGLAEAQASLDQLAAAGVDIAEPAGGTAVAAVEPGAEREPGTIAAAIPPASAPQVRVALLIGNSDYVHAPLGNPEADLSLVGPALESLGFEVTAISNADVATFDSAITEFAKRAERADVALFYYAGHGFALNDGIIVRNYLMSVTADVTATSDRLLRANGIPLDEIVDQVSSAAKVSLFFIDACRNDPRNGQRGGTGRGLAPIGRGGSDIFIGSSTRIGETAADGQPGEGSPFARAFAEKILEPGVRIDDAFTNVRLAVEAETGGQRPEIVRDDLSAPATVILAAAQPE